MFSESRRLLRLAMPKSQGFWLGLFVSVLQGVSAVALLATSAWLISRAAEMPPVLYLQLAVVGVRGFALGRAFFRYVERILLHDAAFKQLALVRPKVFKALVPLAPAGLGKLRSAEMLSRITSDVDELQFLPLRVFAPLLQSAVVTLLSVIGLSLLVPGSAVVLAICCLAAFFVALPITARISRRADDRAASQRADLSAETVKLIESLDELRAFDWLEPQMARVAQAEAKLTHAAKVSAWSQGLSQASFAALSIIATVASAHFAAVAFTTGQLAGVCIAVVTLLPMAVFDVMQAIAPAASAWQRFVASAKRVDEVLSAPLPRYLPQATSGAAAALETLPPFESLELECASIAYDGEPVVRSLDLKLMAGAVLALSGVSGAGKSSVALVVSGFLNLASGKLRYNGVEVGDSNIGALRARVAYLQQHPTVFAGDVAVNLRVARASATDDELIEVLKRVKLWQVFEAREGLATELGEFGRAISGGEAARLAIARALLADFDVLVFDEPTANLDYETASELMEDVLALATERNNRAVLLISHDADLVSKADRVEII